MKCLAFSHHLSKKHNKKVDKHLKYGNWDGHIFKFTQSKTELAQAMAEAGPKCKKYFPKETDKWRYKDPPTRPDRDIGLEGY